MLAAVGSVCIYTITVVGIGDTLICYTQITGGTWNAGISILLGRQIEPGSVATAYRPTASTLESAANANITGFSSAGYTLYADVRPMAGGIIDNYCDNRAAQMGIFDRSLR